MIHSSNKLINRDRGGERRTAANAIPSNNVHKSSADATQLYYTIMWGSGEGDIVYQVYSGEVNPWVGWKEIQPESVL